ncbi:MAG TPA: glutathione S-transferase family protein, partial [Deltaproteobacteria bacterium]|nr:glutathione S-transferase family protein [Deltaproteobacteria bacterium]
VFTNPFDSSPELVAANPLSKVPTLVVDESLTLVDSSIICAYLDELHDEIRFFPTGAARWRVLRTAGIAEGVIDATLALRLESLRPEGTRSAAGSERQLAAVRRGLGVLEAELPELRAEPTIAHVTLGCALAYLDLRLASEPWRGIHPQLARWYEAWSSRPSMVATVHPT